MFAVAPSIDPRIAALAPGFRALSITVEAAALTNPQVGDAALAQACRAVLADEIPWAQAHLEAWAHTFRQFGARPKRTPCSAEALRRRVLKEGALPAIDPLVDLYNAVSLRFAIPVGGENFSAYVGQPRLTVAEGDEHFDTFKAGEPAVESPEKGEVIWRDDRGVTCRRWNWRQGVRTRLGAEAQQMWFILESLPEMPLTALHEAGHALCEGLGQMMPGAKTEIRLTEA